MSFFVLSVQHDLQQLFSRCWSLIRRCGRREQSTPSVALSLSGHQCGRDMVAMPPGGIGLCEEIMLQIMPTDHRQRLSTDNNRVTV